MDNRPDLFDASIVKSSNYSLKSPQFITSPALYRKCFRLRKGTPTSGYEPSVRHRVVHTSYSREHVCCLFLCVCVLCCSTA